MLYLHIHMTKVIPTEISFSKEILTKIDSGGRDVPRSCEESAVPSEEKHVCDGCNMSDILAGKDSLDSSCEPAIKRSRST